ncbi:MAG: T9SS type A sorting domain-containing protein [Prevotellaceae bacterium]|jgi:hypothetical protein|nr:T9SS type A sorting domain-containing protein [Prevotellaceae bacterium]
MKSKLQFLAISLLLMATLSMSAQNIQKFLGEYEIKATCRMEIEGYPWGEETVDYYKIKIEESLEEDADIQFTVPSFVAVAKANVLTEQEFEILQDQSTVGAGGRSYYLNGGGVIRIDSIFMSYQVLDESDTEFICDCKGKRSGSSDIFSLKSDKYKVYINAAQQIVLDEALQNQTLLVELISLQGATMLKKMNDGEPVSIANFPKGVYLLRIFQDGQPVYSDKILK